MAPQYKVFENDELGYTAWLDQNPNGFVLNSERPSRSKYMPLHTAQCYTIREEKKSAREGGFTNFKHIKVCAADYKDLLTWMASQGADVPPYLSSTWL